MNFDDYYEYRKTIVNPIRVSYRDINIDVYGVVSRCLLHTVRLFRQHKSNSSYFRSRFQPQKKSMSVRRTIALHYSQVAPAVSIFLYLLLRVKFIHFLSDFITSFLRQALIQLLLLRTSILLCFTDMIL